METLLKCTLKCKKYCSYFDEQKSDGNAAFEKCFYETLPHISIHSTAARVFAHNLKFFSWFVAAPVFFVFTLLMRRAVGEGGSGGVKRGFEPGSVIVRQRRHVHL